MLKVDQVVDIDHSKFSVIVGMQLPHIERFYSDQEFKFKDLPDCKISESLKYGFEMKIGRWFIQSWLDAADILGLKSLLVVGQCICAVRPSIEYKQAYYAISKNDLFYSSKNSVIEGRLRSKEVFEKGQLISKEIENLKGTLLNSNIDRKLVEDKIVLLRKDRINNLSEYAVSNSKYRQAELFVNSVEDECDRLALLQREKDITAMDKFKNNVRLLYVHLITMLRYCPSLEIFKDINRNMSEMSNGFDKLISKYYSVDMIESLRLSVTPEVAKSIVESGECEMFAPDAIVMSTDCGASNSVCDVREDSLRVLQRGCNVDGL